MFLNTANFDCYVDTFNKIMSVIDDFRKEELSVIIIDDIECRDVNRIIYNIFPKDWIIYGQFYDQNIDAIAIKYFNVRDLSYATLHYLQTKFNQIVAMCDNSIQCLDDFLVNSSSDEEYIVYNRPGL